MTDAEGRAAIWQTFIDLYPGARNLLRALNWWEREARAALLALGTKVLGAPTPEQYVAVGAIHNIDQLETLRERLVDVNTWDELLAGA